jgi:enoyl-[acyl-carrier protein] reductase I
VAFGPKDDVNGPFLQMSRDGFQSTLEVSAYSLIALARRAAPLMTRGGSIVTLSSYASEKVFPRYSVMAVAKAALECEVRYLAAELGPSGIRVNAISAGPIRTLATSTIDGFGEMQRIAAEISPLRRELTIEDAGAAALWLLSDLSTAVTGDVVHVDGGYHVLGVTVGR